MRRRLLLLGNIRLANYTRLLWPSTAPASMSSPNVLMTRWYVYIDSASSSGIMHLDEYLHQDYTHSEQFDTYQLWQRKPSS